MTIVQQNSIQIRIVFPQMEPRINIRRIAYVNKTSAVYVLRYLWFKKDCNI